MVNVVVRIDFIYTLSLWHNSINTLVKSHKLHFESESWEKQLLDKGLKDRADYTSCLYNYKYFSFTKLS